MKYNSMELAQIKKIRGDLEQALLPYSQNTEAGLAAFALLQIARELLRKYPVRVRKELLEEVAIPFLRGETRAPGDRRAGLLVN